MPFYGFLQLFLPHLFKTYSLRHSSFSYCIDWVIRFNICSMCGLLWLFLKSIEMHLQRRNICVFNSEFPCCYCSCVQKVLRWFIFSLLFSCFSVFPSRPSVFSTSVFISRFCSRQIPFSLPLPSRPTPVFNAVNTPPPQHDSCVLVYISQFANTTSLCELDFIGSTFVQFSNFRERFKSRESSL